MENHRPQPSRPFCRLRSVFLRSPSVLLSLPSSSIPPSLTSLPSPAGLAVIAVRPFVVAVFLHFSLLGLSVIIAGLSSVAARFFFRRRPGPSSVAAEPFSRRPLFPGLHEKSPEAALPGIC
ncbi:hypothetical protein [Alistipes finegoldii]|uniref:hypothetical protein n=1 Tax=Alistipes finegoldii TaxID=214856 RepID=UPI00242DBD79|nr:hypothetical protein [Alistipes finegoldii]